jgi:adhesin/invasin
VYTASTTPSGTNGVKITATVPVSPAITGSTTVTVGGFSVFLSMGTGNQISENADKTQFLIPYTIEALDASGSPVSGVSITLTVQALYYGKGAYTAGSTTWIQGNAHTAGNAVLFCPNEDNTSAYDPAKFNGVLDPGEDGCTAGNLDRDTGLPVASPYSCNAYGNGNGRLDPGGTAIAVPGTLVSASDGSANFNIVYPEDQANWVTVELKATATVAGTSNTTVATFTLPILASYLTTLTSSPPGAISPYGQAGVCTNPD